MGFLYQAGTTLLSIIVPLAAGYFLRDVSAPTSATSRKGDGAKAMQREGLEESEKGSAMRKEKLDSRKKALDERETELLEREKKLIELDLRASELEEREAKLSSRENKLKQLEEREAALNDKERSLVEREKNLEDRGSAVPAVLAETTVRAAQKEQEERAEDEARKGGSEKENRIKMIKDELRKIVKQAEEEELDEEMEKEASEALEKAAMVVCYRKKYYDVMKDELIYFPTVSKTIVSYALMEEAEKYYWEEEDEFPMDYSVALRSVVTMNMCGDEDDDDMDEEYMAKLALDVDI